MKSILYAPDAATLDRLVGDLWSNETVLKYDNAAIYFEGVLNLKESWCLAFRGDLMLRQNNTNNYIESQFLVIKDQILNRVKEYNVVGLLGKLVNELENHYTTKLLSVADGSFDGIYSCRFKGQVSLPSAAKLTKLCEGVASVGVEVLHVDSFREPDTKYLVDMNLGVCQCAQGSTGAPCKHQFLLWSRGFSSSSENYIPVYSAALKKQYADLAVNGSALIEFYEGIRERLLPSCHVSR